MAIRFAGTHILDTFVAKNRNLNSFTPFNPHIFLMRLHKMIRCIGVMTALFAVSMPAMADKYGYPDFAIGADISWCTQMADQNVRMLDAQGNPTTAPDLMASYNMDAVRLRVFVDPTTSNGYDREMGASSGKSYCDINDLVAKGLAAKERKQRVMLCVHFSDNWADPSKQRLPQSWSGFTTTDEMAAAASAHVTAALGALRNAGVHVEWVQLGNETRSGMLYQKPNGTDISSSAHTAKVLKNPTGAKNFVTIFSAAAAAAKSIYPEVKTMIMLDDAPNLSRYTAFLGSTGTDFDFDYVGMSLYPVNEQTFMTDAWQENADKTLNTIKEIYKRYGKRTILCEIGMPTAWSKVDGVDQKGEAAVAAQCSKDVKACLDYLIPRLKDSTCDGIFYWEPQSYNFNNYNKGAMTYEGKPNGVWDAMRDNQQPGFILANVDYPEISGDLPEIPEPDRPVEPARSNYFLQVDKEWELTNTDHLFMTTDNPHVFTLGSVIIGDPADADSTPRVTVVDRVDNTTGSWYYADHATNPDGFNVEPGMPFKMKDVWQSNIDGDAILPAPGVYDVVWNDAEKTLLFTHSVIANPQPTYWFLVGLNDWAEPLLLGGTDDSSLFKAFDVDIEQFQQDDASGFRYGNRFGVVKSSSEDVADIDWTNVYGGGDIKGWNLDLACQSLTLTLNKDSQWAWTPLRGTYDIIWNPATATIEFDTKAPALYIVGEGIDSWNGVGERLVTEDGKTYKANVNQLSGQFVIVEAEVNDSPSFKIDWNKGIKFGIAEDSAHPSPAVSRAMNTGYVGAGTYLLTEITSAEDKRIFPMTTNPTSDVAQTLSNTELILEYDVKSPTALLTVRPPVASGIEDVPAMDADSSATVEYFSIDGRKVSSPLPPGLYIRRQGQSATKIYVN